MNKKVGKILRFVLRWTIAVVGMVWVFSQIHLNDRVNVLDSNNIPQSRDLAASANEDSLEYRIIENGVESVVPTSRVINAPDRKTVVLIDQNQTVKLLGMRLRGDLNKSPQVDGLLVEQDEGKSTAHGSWISPMEVQGGYKLDVPKPRVEQGAKSMVQKSDLMLLLMGLLIAPTNYFITTFRWRKLLEALKINMSLWVTFSLNMVGSFYNSFMPGSTGGDLVKAYYAAKQAPDRRTYAVMSVLVDRVLGLIALIILGGTMSGVQYFKSADSQDPVAKACMRVAVVSVVILSGMAVSLWLFYHPEVRRFKLLRAIYDRLPGKDQIRRIADTMDLYRKRPGLIVWAVVVTFPVHLVTILSTMFACKAFGLPLSTAYYFIVVPVVVLVGAIPISPQGVGVMEYFAFYLTARQGATVNQALALTMSIRLIAMFWNLWGGLFVLKGGYHAPTQAEEAELEAKG